MNWKDNWKQAQAVLDRHSMDDNGPGIYLNLKDGDKAKIVFLPGAPFARERRWDALDRQSRFPQEISNPNEQLPNGKPRYERLRAEFSFNVYDTSTKTVRILECNATTTRLIMSAFDMLGGQTEAVFELSRRGGGMDTTYSLSKVVNLTPEQKEKMHALWLSDAHDLEDIMGLPSLGPNGSNGSSVAPQPVAAVVDDFDLF